MIAKTKRAGRPNTGMVRTNVTIDLATRVKAAKIGGTVSEGIRLAVAAYRVKK